MASSVVVPNIHRIANYGPELAQALIDVATAAKADIDANVTASISATTPENVGAAGSAGVSTDVSASDHVHADPNRAAAGANLTDTATQTIQITGGTWRKLPTLGQGGTLTLGTVGAVAGDQIEITRTDTSAFTYAVVNGGTGAGTLLTFPASKIGSAKFQFDGTDWALRSVGYQP